MAGKKGRSGRKRKEARPAFNAFAEGYEPNAKASRFETWLVQHHAAAMADATQEIASAVLNAAGAAMERHGNDPNGSAIVAAGFAMALRSIGNIDPHIPRIVHAMLSKDQ